MFAAIIGAVVRRIIFDHFDVGGQARARIGAFDEIMTEQSVAREATVEHLLHGIDFIDSFSRENAFAIQILIHIRDRARVDIEPGLSGINICQP